MKKKDLIKSALQIVVAIVIGLGVALTAKGEEFAENGWAVALITSGCVFSFIELACKTMEERAFKWKGVFLNVALAMVSYFVNYLFLLR